MNTPEDSQIVLDAVNRIYNRFGLEEQGKEFVSLISQLLGNSGVGLFYLDETGQRLKLLAGKPAGVSKQLADSEIDLKNRTIKACFKSGQILNGKDTLFSKFIASITSADSTNAVFQNIELIMPLLHGKHLTGILCIKKRKKGDYSPNEIHLIEEITSSLTPGLEKEYLREKLVEREKELLVLTACCGIIASSFDLPVIFEKFANELNKILDISWMSLTIIENDVMTILASYSDSGTNWQPGESMLLEGTATQKVQADKIPLVEPDLKKESLFVADIYHLNEGIRSIVCIPLIENSDVIGSLIVGSRSPEAYSRKQVEFLNTVVKHISLPVKNARLYAEVLEKSSFDKLTGLYNRRSMDEHITGEISRHSRYGGVFSLILLDLDAMKLINDHYGHLAGDGILSRTGKVIREAIRNVDKAFRYGGDEFAILLPNTPAESAIIVSERIRSQLAEKLVVDSMTVTASFGLACWPANGSVSDQLIAAADAALYKAKNGGRNRICMIDDPV